MEFVRSEKGARKLIQNGYMYVHHKDLADEVNVMGMRAKKKRSM